MENMAELKDYDGNTIGYVDASPLEDGFVSWGNNPEFSYKYKLKAENITIPNDHCLIAKDGSDRWVTKAGTIVTTETIKESVKKNVCGKIPSEENHWVSESPDGWVCLIEYDEKNDSIISPRCNYM